MFQKKQGLFWLLTLLMVGGCSNEVATKAGSDLPSAAEPPVIAQEKSNDHHKTHRGKPGAEVSLRENPVHRLEPGVAADVDLGLSASYNLGEMTVTLNTSEGLFILEGATHYAFPLRDNGDYSLPLRLMAAEPGRYYVRIQVVVDYQGRQTTRALSAIVQVGPDTEPRQKTGTSEGVIPLPAQETVIQQP